MKFFQDNFPGDPVGPGVLLWINGRQCWAFFWKSYYTKFVILESLSCVSIVLSEIRKFVRPAINARLKELDVARRNRGSGNAKNFCQWCELRADATLSFRRHRKKILAIMNICEVKQLSECITRRSEINGNRITRYNSWTLPKHYCCSPPQTLKHYRFVRWNSGRQDISGFSEKRWKKYAWWCKAAIVTVKEMGRIWKYIRKSVNLVCANGFLYENK